MSSTLTRSWQSVTERLTTDMTHTDAAARLFLRALWGAVGRVGRGIRWYVTELMGDSAYRVYLEHHARTHVDDAPLSERAFWRQKMDDQDRNPGARCC